MLYLLCDSENAFLSDFNVYLGKGNASEHGLGYVATRMIRDITESISVYISIIISQVFS